MNFGRRWRVPKLVLAIPGSAEFLARAPGVWQKRAAIIKAHLSHPRISPATPLHVPSRPVPSRPVASRHEASPRLPSPHLTSPHLTTPPCYHRAAAHSLARSPVRSVPLRRVAAGGGVYPPPTTTLSPLARNRKGETARWRAQARGSNGKKSAGLTTGDGRRIDRANIGDRESARVYGYNRERCSHDDGGGYTRRER